MLLETALEEFSYENDWIETAANPGDTPLKSLRKSCRSRSFNEVKLNGSRLQLKEGADNGIATLVRCSSEHFYGDNCAVPFEHSWKACPGILLCREAISFGSRTNESKSLPFPATLRATATSSVRPVYNIMSPTKVGSLGKVTGALAVKGLMKVNVRTASPERTVPECSRSEREDSHNDSVDADTSSPVSTLDLPKSPHTPTCSAKQKQGIAGRHGGRLGLARRSSRSTDTISGLRNMLEDLPVVVEGNREDGESMSGFHTIELCVDSPCTGLVHQDWSVSEGAVSSNSLSAPNSRQCSSLRPEAASRGRRRSDFDWPEDFDERPEEVVKEVDDSLWAFSPVASTFVFSGNETTDTRSPSPQRGVTVTLTAPGPCSGPALQQLSFRRSLVRSSPELSHGMRLSAETEFAGQRKSSRLRHYSVNGDDDYLSSSGHPMKRSYSCLRFFSLCSSQRLTPSVSFSQRLSSSLSNLKN